MCVFTEAWRLLNRKRMGTFLRNVNLYKNCSQVKNNNNNCFKERKKYLALFTAVYTTGYLQWKVLSCIPLDVLTKYSCKKKWQAE